MKGLFLLFMVVYFTSCDSNQVDEKVCEVDNPLENLTWLKEIRVGFELSSFYVKRKILQYDYKNETVFFIDSCNGCADNLTIVYNCEGSIICEFGGIGGLNTCADFTAEATNEITLWEN